MTPSELRTRLLHRLASLKEEWCFTDQTQVEDVENDSGGAQAFGRWCELRFVLDLIEGKI